MTWTRAGSTWTPEDLSIEADPAAWIPAVVAVAGLQATQAVLGRRPGRRRPIEPRGRGWADDQAEPRPSWRSGDRTRPGSRTGRAARGAARPGCCALRAASARSGPGWRSPPVRCMLMLRWRSSGSARRSTAAIARRDADEPQAPYWLGLSKEEHAARLAELRAWVERVALVQYPDVLRQAAALLASPAER